VKQRVRQGVSPRDEFQESHFRGAKPGRGRGQFFQQVAQGRPQQRQGAQIHAEQTKAGLRCRCPVSLPGQTGRLKFILGEVDRGPLPPAKLLRGSSDQVEVNKAHFRFGDSLGMRMEIIEQPNQQQSIVWIWIEP
jgi:hypothetical protein